MSSPSGSRHSVDPHEHPPDDEDELNNASGSGSASPTERLSPRSPPGTARQRPPRGTDDNAPTPRRDAFGAAGDRPGSQPPRAGQLPSSSHEYAGGSQGPTDRSAGYSQGPTDRSGDSLINPVTGSPRTPRTAAALSAQHTARRQHRHGGKSNMTLPLALPHLGHSSGLGGPASNRGTVAPPSPPPVSTNFPVLEDLPDDPVTSRILSLPNIVCRSAGGDLFIVELDDVQHMLHKRRIGTAGMKVLAKHANSRQTMNEADTKKQLTSAGMMRRKMAVKGGLAEAQAATVQAALREQGGNGTEVDTEVSRHMALTTAKTEALRHQLATAWAQRGADTPREEDEAALLLREQESLQAAAADMVVKTAPRRRGAAPVLGHIKPDAAMFERMQDALAGSGPGTPVKAKSPVKSARWGKVSGVINSLDNVDKYPFMGEWDKVTRKLRHDDDGGGSGWDELLSQNEIYVKGKVDVQGGTVYVMRCHELGVVPSTQVVQQLGQADSNMSHSKLGRRGAMALRHALAANNTITSLNLSDNGFDSTAVSEILRGLTLGTLANAPAARKQLTLRWQRLEFIKQKPAELSVNLLPISLQQERAHVANSRNPSPARGGRGPSEGGSGSPVPPDAAADPLGGLLLPSVDESDEAVAAAAAAEATAANGGNSGATTQRMGGTFNFGRPPVGVNMSSLMCQITTLDLSSNPLGIYGARIVAEVIDPMLTAYQFLTALHLNKCSIPELGGIAIFKAIMNSNTALTLLSLANNQLGNKSSEVLAELLPSNRTLTDLSLAWNKIGPDGMVAMCKGLEYNRDLAKLDLSWNGLENPGVRAVGAMMCTNCALKYLDLTSTRMGSEACLMLSEGIRQNKTLETLLLNNNAVGDDGARHLMNALRANDSLQFLGLQGANMTSAARGHNAGALFNPLAPDGAYSLNLHDPSDRSVAMQLCTLDRASPHDLMRNIKCDGRNIASCRQGSWPDALPASGQLSCDFVSKRQKREMKLMDDQKFLAIYSQMAVTGGNMSDREKLGLITVMAPFSYMTCKQVATMLSAFSICEEQVETAAILFTRTVDAAIHTGLMLDALHENERRSLLQLLSWYLHSRFDNPTGHYELSLSNPLHHHMAIRLKDVAYTENDFNNWNNMIYDKAASTVKFAGNYGPPESWKGIIPTTGTLTVDYTSDSTAPGTATPLEEPAFLKLLQSQVSITLSDATGEPQPDRDFDEGNKQVAALRACVTGSIYFTCAQLVRIASCFEYGPHRVEACVIVYARLVDLKNFWTVLYSLRPLEQGLLSVRLGPANVFDRNHASIHYILDLGNPAHEFVAKQLIQLCSQTVEMPNFWNLRLQGTKRYISENRNMWGTFTADTFSPLLEFDFAGPDSFDVLGRTRQEVDQMLPGDRLDMRTKQMKRCELWRIKQMYGYFDDGSGWIGPAWQSKVGLFKPHLDKPPWLASWDRMLRVLYRCDMRTGDIESDSYLEDIYEEFSKSEEFLTLDEFDTILKAWGYNKAELLHHYRRGFDEVAKVPEESDGGGLVIDFHQFVPIIMSEPPSRLRMVRDKDAVGGVAVEEAPPGPAGLLGRMKSGAPKSMMRGKSTSRS